MPACRKGQSTIEYILIVTVVFAAALYVVFGSLGYNSNFQVRLNGVYSSGADSALGATRQFAFFVTNSAGSAAAAASNIAAPP